MVVYLPVLELPEPIVAYRSDNRLVCIATSVVLVSKKYLFSGNMVNQKSRATFRRSTCSRCCVTLLTSLFVPFKPGGDIPGTSYQRFVVMLYNRSKEIGQKRSLLTECRTVWIIKFPLIPLEVGPCIRSIPRKQQRSFPIWSSEPKGNR